MRKARVISSTNIYHVMMRGNNHQKIYRDIFDRKFFLARMKKYLTQLNLELYAWCLMDNHFHLVIKASKNDLSLFIKKLCCSYVPYFNRKYERSGHLFQDRFKSEPVETQKYLLGVIRYVHNNPEKAGIAPTTDYFWSSYKEYITKPKIINPSLLLGILNGQENYINYSKQTDNYKYLENRPRIWDKKATQIIMEILKEYKIQTLKSVSNKIRKRVIVQLIERGLSLYQISRLTDISRCSHLYVKVP